MRRAIGCLRDLGRPLLRLCAFALLLAAPRGFAQATDPALEQRLDRRIDTLRIGPAPIAEALEKLGRHTQIRIELPRESADLLPYGGRTRIQLDVRDKSVRDALDEMFAGLGLEPVVELDAVVLRPALFVADLGRRLSTEEAGAIERLARQRWTPADGVSVELRVAPDARARFERSMHDAPGNGLRQFDATCAALGWSWRPEGGSVIVEPRAELFRRRLAQTPDMSYQNVRLDALIFDLCARVRVPLQAEPGSLARVAAGERGVSLVQKKTSVSQILEHISGNTGLTFEVTDRGLRVSAPAEAPPPAAAPLLPYPTPEAPQRARPAPMVPATSGDASAAPPGGDLAQWVRITVEVRPGLKVDAFVPVSQLPAEFRAELERALRSVLASL